MTNTHRRTIVAERRRWAGMTLIELMVALAIGSFLTLGAVTVFLQGRETFRVNETVSRLQENARFVLDAIEPDIRMAHYYGLTTRSGKISNRQLQSMPHETWAGPSGCGNNWAIDLEHSIEGTNNTYAGGCAADTSAMAGADTLTIRRVAEDAVGAGGPVAGRMYIQSWRLQPGQIFTGSPAPSTDPTSEIHQLVVTRYYVDQDSSLSTATNTVPSLRMKTLVSGPAIQDQEVLPGVEDFQVEFGVDTDDPSDPAVVGRGVVDRFVNPDDGIITMGDPSYLSYAEILAVRVWVLVRAELPEVGYTNENTYEYASKSVTPNDSYRRLLVSKTIYIRNARPAT